MGAGVADGGGVVWGWEGVGGPRGGGDEGGEGGGGDAEGVSLLTLFCCFVEGLLTFMVVGGLGRRW